jgi:hypothetical protein
MQVTDLGLLGAVLLGFHLYLLVHWEKVVRPGHVIAGFCGLGLMALGLAGWGYAAVVGLLVALLAAGGACYPGPEPFPPPRNEQSTRQGTPPDENA